MLTTKTAVRAQTGLKSILQVSTADIGSGAEKFARDLQTYYRTEGYESWLAVGSSQETHADTVVIPHAESRDAWGKYWWQLQDRLLETSAPGSVKRGGSWLMRRIAEPLVAPSIALGLEDFHYPGTKRIPDLTPVKPDLIHCHNLHGAYFDLRQLSSMSAEFPVVLTMHDTWLMTGHCSYTFGCQRYQTGCGHCPDLSIPNPIKIDSTRQNWKRKKDIYAKSRLYVATPSQWLMNMVEKSSLMEGVVQRKVIPNGVDLNLFTPGKRSVARKRLGLSDNEIVFLFTATNAQKNFFKDYETLRSAIESLADLVSDRPVVFLTLGGDESSEQIGNVQIKGVPFVTDPAEVAGYYQAADIYLHCAKQENFPLTILEAFGCGVPVIATAVGGVTEQVRGLRIDGITSGAHNKWSTQEATGILVAPGDVEGFVRCIHLLVANRELREQLGENAAWDARAHFSLTDCANDYVEFYNAARESHLEWLSTSEAADLLNHPDRTTQLQLNRC